MRLRIDHEIGLRQEARVDLAAASTLHLHALFDCVLDDGVRRDESILVRQLRPMSLLLSHHLQLHLVHLDVNC